MSSEPVTNLEGSVVDPRDAAESAGLVYITDATPGITRRRAGDGFTYHSPDGTRIRDEAEIARIESLAIPPAYEEVWISPKRNGHIQATGRDARGRKQYRYHPRFRDIRDGTKYEHMVAFAKSLPKIRRATARHMRLPGLHRKKVLATVVNLLETTLIRVGNDDYAKANRSYGLTTLRNRHVAVKGAELKFVFTGKSGKVWNLAVRNGRVAKTIRQLQDLPGQQLFQYVDETGERRGVDSGEVNDYLREISGAQITAKDFRTWAGTVLAAMALREFEACDSEAIAKKNVRAAIEQVSAKLGNTPTICRKCYVHPELIEGYLQGEVLGDVKAAVEEGLSKRLSGLRPEEAAVLAMLQGRLRRVLARKRNQRSTLAALKASARSAGGKRTKGAAGGKKRGPRKNGPTAGRRRAA